MFIREIKLRAWDYFNEEMVYGNEEDSRFLCKDGKWSVRYVREKTITKNDIEQDVPVWHESEEVEMMLFTGLKDIKGKEIYDGDIVQCHTTGKIKWPHLGKVEYVHSFFAINCGKNFDDCDEFTPLSQNEDYEVIGNIYEHSNLLANV